MRGRTLRIAAAIVFCLVVCAVMAAQTRDDSSSDPIRQPGWNFGVQVSGGSTVVQVSNASFVTANRNISNFAASFRVGRVLTHEHGRGWSRGQFINFMPHVVRSRRRHISILRRVHSSAMRACTSQQH
jgi:hypothetical protein